MSHAKRISELSREGQEERAELAHDLAAARARAGDWKRRAGPWILAAAGLAAAAGAVAGVASIARRVRRGRFGGRALARVRSSFQKANAGLDRYRPRPIPVTLLFALLRTPMARRALVSGAGKLISGGRPRDAGEGEEDDRRVGKPGDADADADAGDAIAPDRKAAGEEARRRGPEPASQAEKLRERAGDARRKEKANRAAPSEEEGEEKAKETLRDLKHATWRQRLGFAWELFRDAFRNFQRDEALTRGAALAYYTVLSLAPLLLVVVAVAGLAFGQDAVRTQILAQIQNLVGADAAKTLAEIMRKASEPAKSIPATIIGVATLLLGAGGVFGYLQQMMNKIWGVPERKGGGIWNLIRSRFLSLAMVLGTGFLLLVSLVVSAALSAIGRRMGDDVGLVFSALHTLLSWAVVGLLFALIFRYLPDTRIAWRDVWIGAGITSLLFALGQFLIGLYLGRSSVASVYGGAGSLLIVLLWTYYSGLILFFGAEVTQVFANRWGSRKDAPKKAA